MPDPAFDPWGDRTPYGRDGRWPERVDVHLAEGITEEDVDRWVQSASLLHSNGDAMDIAVVDGRIAGVRGRAVDRVNRGRLDPKDRYGWQANLSSDRLARPLIRRAGQLVECSWDEAMGAVVERTQALLDRPGGSSRMGHLLDGEQPPHRRVRRAAPSCPEMLHLTSVLVGWGPSASPSPAPMRARPARPRPRSREIRDLGPRRLLSSDVPRHAPVV